jgi:periplasmic divalent cation tolerance protein
MTGDDGYCVILCSCPNDEHAEKLARSLVEHKFAACVQITPIRSFYEWKGEICKDEEQLLMIKTKTVFYDKIEDFVTMNHPYEVPEIVMLPITGGLEKYFKWIEGICT